MAIPFMSEQSEETATQKIAFVAIVGVTLGLLVWNVVGAILGSEGTSPVQIIARCAFAFLLAGAELLTAVAIVRVMLAPNRLRKVLGFLVFLGLAWVCIQNGMRTSKYVFPEFATSSALLDAQSDIAQKEADFQDDARNKAVDARPAALDKVGKEIAELKAEQQLMASQSPENIKRSQALLIAQGKYFGEVDGIREGLTESAMRARGEEISQELTRLKLREESLMAGAATVVATAPRLDADGNPVLSAAERKAVLDEQSRKAKAAELWIEVMLWVLEGARSLGLWLYVTTITSKNAQITQRATLAEAETGAVEAEAGLAEAANKLEAVELGEPSSSGQLDEEAPGAVTPPADEVPPPPSPQRKGGMASAHAKKAKQDPVIIPVEDFSEQDIIEEAA